MQSSTFLIFDIFDILYSIVHLTHKLSTQKGFLAGLCKQNFSSKSKNSLPKVKFQVGNIKNVIRSISLTHQKILVEFEDTFG